jgi:heptosyltransferase-2
MSESLVAALKRRNPAANIHLLAPAWSAPLGDRMPGVSATHIFSSTRGKLELRRRIATGVALRKENFDVAILLPNSLKTSIIPFAAHIPIRRGYVGELRYGFLNDLRTLDKGALPRTIDRFVALASDRGSPPAAVTHPVLRYDADAALRLAQKFSLEDKGRPVVVLCPGAEYGPSKQWPATHFARLATILAARGFATWILGSSKDRPVAEEIVRLAGTKKKALVPFNLCGATTLLEAIDLMALATGVVSNDSGLMHVAAAIGRPVVALFGSTTSSQTPPLATRFRIVESDLPCRPCFERVCPLGHGDCLKTLQPKEVADALKEICEPVS